MYAAQARALTDKAIKSDHKRPELTIIDVIARITQTATDEKNPAYHVKIEEYLSSQTVEELKRLRYIVVHKGKSTLIIWG